MKETVAVTAGRVWKIEQNMASLDIVLYKYGTEVGRWPSEHVCSWEELHEMLLHKSYELRGEN